MGNIARQGYEFSEGTKNQAKARQGAVCALCGKPLSFDEDKFVAHHVIPAQTAIRFALGKDFTKSLDNCVALHPECHQEAHNYNFHTGAVSEAQSFPHSHGKDNSTSKEHQKWAGNITNIWDNTILKKGG